MSLRVNKHSVHATKDRKEELNGILVPIFNVYDEFYGTVTTPQQIYVTICNQGKVKGPHLHNKRSGLFTCIKGNMKLIARVDGVYEEYYSGENYDYATIEVPPGVPSALQNIGDEPAYILNMPSPAWKPDDRDEHSVTFDESVFTHKRGEVH